jgi:hypothetical protein
MIRALAMIVLGLVGASCRRPDPDRSEAQEIVRRFEDFQTADRSDRAAALEALAAAPCREPTLCAHRDACARYGADLMRAQELAGKARALGPVDAGGNGAATKDELAIIVAGAEEATARATRAHELCSAALDQLYARARPPSR